LINARKTTYKFNTEQINQFAQPQAAEVFLSPIDLYGKPITDEFSRDESPIKNETAHFKAFHFIKFKLQGNLNARQRSFWHRMYTLLRNRLVVGNRKLVYKCVRKSFCTQPDDSKFIGAGNLTLINAVEGFDPWLGNSFSTYAYRALLHTFSQIAYSKYSTVLDVTEYDVPAEEPDHEQEFLIDRMKSAISQTNLTTQEAEIIRMRFYDGLKLEDISHMYDVTKERIRQIQNKALDKIRAAMQKDQLVSSHFSND